MDITIIAALSENRVIGNKGQIPWFIPEDLARFKRLTTDNSVIMGRETYNSIIARLNKPLPNRNNIVLSSSMPPTRGIIIARSLDDALKEAEKFQVSAFVIGGQQVYESALPYANRMELTHVKGKYEGDRFFPDFDENEWNVANRDPRGEYEFITYLRK